MNANYARSPRRDHLLYPGRIEVMSARIDIAKDRGDRLPLERVGGSDEGKRGNNYFTCHSQRANRNFQSHSAVTHSNAMLDAGKLRDPALELIDVTAAVGNPLSFQNVSHAFMELLAIADVGPPHVQTFRERRLSAKDGQLV